MNRQEEDRIKVRIYQEFYESHIQLFKDNPLEYHKQCMETYERTRLRRNANDRT